MAGISVYTKTLYGSDNFGRFIRRLNEAQRKAADTVGREGVAIAQALAPKKTGAMAGSIHSSATAQGVSWSVNTDHWQFNEFGAAPHAITGRVSFFWAREGRRWVPGNNTISHPGTPKVAFMEISYDAVKGKFLGLIRSYL